MSRQRSAQLYSLLVVAAFIALAVVFRATVFTVGPPAHAKDGKAARKPPPVSFMNPRRGSIRRMVRMAADIKPDREARIYGQVSGYVTGKPVEVGTRIDPNGPNSVLVRISVPEIDARVTTAKSRVARTLAASAEADAAVLEARQGLAEAKALERQSQGMIKLAEAKMGEAQADLDLQEKIFARLRAGREKSKDLVVQDRVDRAEGARDIALAKLTAAQVGVQKAKDDAVVAAARVSAADARVTAAHASVDAAKAETALAGSQLEEAKAMQAFATIRAPFKGVVAERLIDTGDLVKDASRNSGAMPLFRVVADDKLRIRFYLAEPDCPACVVGHKVELTVDVLPDREFTGTVTRIADALDSKTRTMEVEAELDNPKDKEGRKMLRADMFARVKVYLEEYANMLIVPSRAVKTKKRKSSILVIQDDDTVNALDIKIGADDGKDIVIFHDKINESTRIVVRGGNLVSEGEKVVPVRWSDGEEK